MEKILGKPHREKHNSGYKFKHGCKIIWKDRHKGKHSERKGIVHF